MTDDKKAEPSTAKATEAKEKKLSKKVESLVDEIAKLSVIELSELVGALQEKLGVSAAAPVAAAIPQPASQEAQGQAEGQVGAGAPTQTLTMTQAGNNKISVIKALREINQNWGLKEAKDMTEQTPQEILKDAKAEEVKTASEKLKAAGATVEVK